MWKEICCLLKERLCICWSEWGNYVCISCPRVYRDIYLTLQLVGNNVSKMPHFLFRKKPKQVEHWLDCAFKFSSTSLPVKTLFSNEIITFCAFSNFYIVELRPLLLHLISRKTISVSKIQCCFFFFTSQSILRENLHLQWCWDRPHTCRNQYS